MAKISFGRGRRSGRAAVAAGVLVVVCAALTASSATASSAVAEPAPVWTAPVTVDAAHSLTAISCTGLSLCVGVASNGDVVTSAAPASASPAWQVAAPGALATPVALSCPSGTFSFCVAAIGAGKVAATTNPAAAWPSTTIDTGHLLTGVSCPTSSLCVAVDNDGNVFTTAAPTAATPIWTEETGVDGTTALNGISCPTASFCAAVDANRKVLTSTAPATASSWQSATLAASATAISCNSATACVAIDATGNAYATADAGTPPVTWSTTTVDPSPNVPKAVSCSGGGLCVIVDGQGHAITSDDFAASRPTWTTATIDTNALGGVSCDVSGFCVAVDVAGQAVAATVPLPVPTTGTGTASDQTDAALTGTVDPGDAALTDCHFDIGTTTAYGTTVPCATTPATAGGPQAVTAAVSGLLASTTYHFRVDAATGVATQDGADGSFTTPAPLKASPSLAGTPAVGSTLTCKPNVTTTATETVAFQWLSDTVPIANATAATYLVQATDASHHLSCQVTIAGDGGSAAATSGFDAVPANAGVKLTESVVGTAKDSARGTVSAPVTCSVQAAGGGCTFTLKLTTPETVNHKRKAVTIGSVKTTVSPGATKTLSVGLSASGRKLLANKHRLAVTFSVRGTLFGTLIASLQTDRFTFTSKAAKKKHATRHAKKVRRASTHRAR